MNNDNGKVRCVECRCFDQPTQKCMVLARKIERFQSKRRCKLFAKPERIKP